MDAKTADELLDYLGVPVWGRKPQGQNAMFFCPLHDDDKQSAGIHLEKEVFNCYVCGGYTIPQLIREVHGFKIGEAIEIFRTKFHGGVLSWEQIKERNEQLPPKKPEPKYLTEVQLESLPYADLSARGLREETVRRFGARYFGKKCAVLYPGFGYPDRSYRGHSFRVLGHPRIRCGNPTGFDRGELLFGLFESGLAKAWKNGRREEAIVVEGPVDTMWVWQETGRYVVGLYGSKVSTTQARLLKHCRSLILFLDHDWSGIGGLWRAWKLLGQSLPMRVATYPAESWELDPADLTTAEVQAALQGARRAHPALFRTLAPRKNVGR